MGGTYDGDIDVLFTPGAYWCRSDTITNWPYGAGTFGVLEVYHTSGIIIQRITRYSTTGNYHIATRLYANNQWYAWGAVACTPVAS